MKILYYISGWDGCGRYRIELVAKYLNKIPEIHAKVSSQYSLEDIKWADIIVIQKQTNQKALPFMQKAKQMGKKIISEVDDCYFCIPKTNPAYKFYCDKEQDLINFYKLSDALTVTTDHLAKELSKYNDLIYILPNSLDIALQDRLEKLKEEEKFKYTKYLTTDQKEIPLNETQEILSKKIKFFWAGSPTHYIDLQQVTSTLKKICSENKDILLLMGACTTEALIKGISKDQLILVAPVAIFNYHQVLTTIPADVGICPIEDNRFNKSKSALKFLEFSINGFPCICSDVENYKKTVIHGETGLLSANIDESWYSNLTYLINNPEERKRIGDNARKFVRENYNIAENVKLWLECYMEVLKK